MAQLLTVKVPQDDSAALRSIGAAKNVPFSQVFSEFFSRLASNPKAFGEMIADRIRGNVQPIEKNDVEMIGIYLGRDLHRKFIDVSNATLISRTALATLVIQTIVDNHKDILKEA